MIFSEIVHGLGEAPRELLEGGLLWLWGLIAGAAMARRHIVRPARERHDELISRHDDHEKRLKALGKDAP